MIASQLLVLLMSVAATQPELPVPDSVLKTLDRSHPRLMLKDADLEALKKRIEADPLLARCRDELLKKADAMCRQPAVEYKLIGPRLLHASRECVNRMYALGLAWRLTGRQVYADKARENLLAACQFPDWNPSHFLDTAEMAHAVGIGYDWFFHAFDEPTRAKIRRGLIDKALAVDIDARGRNAKFGWWRDVEHNWNQVCNGGLVAGALAVAETDPELAIRTIRQAVATMPKALRSYEPDGAWGEGPGYWNYATSYTVFALAALDTALGTDFGLSERPGLAQAGYFPLLATGPTGLHFNFADAAEDSRTGPMPCLFWLARRYGNAAFAAAEREFISRGGSSALDMIWYRAAQDEQDGPRAGQTVLAMDKLFGGSVEIAVFRGAWGDPNALFVAAKAGYNQCNHAHLDVGNFVLDALGTRWVRDLGSDDYNLPDYWGKSQSATRWTYYRLGSLSHNVPLIDGGNQDVNARTRFIKFAASRPDQAGGRAVIDLSSAYKPKAGRVTRGIAMLAARRAVLVQDEFELAQDCQVAFGLTTDAKVELAGGQATLSRGGRRCIVSLLSPQGQWQVESAEQNPPQNRNKGVSRLVFRAKCRPGPFRVAVLFAPDWPAGGPVAAPPLTPLADW